MGDPKTICKYCPKRSETECFIEKFHQVSLSIIMFHQVSKFNFQKLSKIIQYWAHFEATFTRISNSQTVKKIKLPVQNIQGF
jgi:hypothetical protein